MACIKKYYAENGEESILFNQLVEEYGEAKAEEIYLRLYSGEFQELFQEETEIAADLTPKSELSRQLDEISDKTPFLRDIELIGNMNQYAQYLSSTFPDTFIQRVVWSEPSDRTAKPNSLKSTIQQGYDSGELQYFVISPTFPKNLRDAAPYYLHVNEPYITNSFYKDQTNFERNSTYSFVSELAADYDAIVRDDGNGVSTIAIIPTSQFPKRATALRLGSREDADMFREWIRRNPLEGPTIKIKTPKYDFSGSVYDINGEPRIDIVTNPTMLNKILNLRMQKMTPSELANNLIASADGKIESPKGPNYSVLGKNIQRVSTVLDRPEFAPYTGSPSGQPYEEKGTRYHEIVQDLIQGKSIQDVVSTHNVLPQEMGFVNQVLAFIKSRKALGGQLLSEIRVASLEADNGNGIAGTIDIIHIMPNGRAIIFDLKTANNTEVVKRNQKEIWDLSYNSFYKARRYTYQTMLYASLLEKGDSSTGRVPIPVDGIYVIPVEVTYGDNLEDLVNVNMKNPQDIKTNNAWKKNPKGKTFYEKSKKKIEELVNGTTATPKKSKIKSEIDGRSLADFLKGALGINSSSPAASARQRAINFVERVSSEDKSFTIGNNNYKWDSINREDRIAQVEQIFIKQADNHGIISTEELISYFREGYKDPDTDSPSASYDINSRSPIVRARTERVKKILDSANATRVQALPGHENVVLIHRNDGTYDLLTLTDVPVDTEIPVATKNRTSALYRSTGGGIQDSLFGNYLTALEANTKRVTLRNTYGDYERLRLGLISMELSSRNPNIKINRIIVDSMNSTNNIFPRVAPMKEIMHNIQVMHSIPEIKNQEPAELKQILEDETIYNEARYGDDPIQDLYDYLTTGMEETKESKNLAEEIERYEKKQIDADYLANQLLEGSSGLLTKLRSTTTGTPKEQIDAISSDPIFQTLSRAYISLKGYGFFPDADITSRFAGEFLKWVSNPNMTGNRLADKFFEIFRVHVNNIKRKMDDFTREKEPIIQALILQDSMLKRGFQSPLAVTTKNFGGTDALLGMGRTVFDHLLVTKTDSKGNRYRIPMLHAKGSAEYNALSKADQNFIDYFNKTMKKYNPKWTENLVPIVNISSETKLFRSKQALARGDFRKASGDAKDSVKIFWDMASNRGNFQTGENAPQAFSDVPYDAFSGQMINDDAGGFTTKALERIGLDGNMNLFDSDANESFETDLEKIMSLFALSYIRKDEMKKALPKYQMYRSALKYVESAYGADQTGKQSREDVIKMMDDYVQDLAFNLKQGEDRVLSKAFNISIQLSSIALIGMNPKVFIGNTAQATVAGGMEAFLNTVTKDPRFPSLKDYTKAWGIMGAAMANPALARKIYYLRRMYLTDDVGRFTSDRHMLTARGMINQQTAYAIDSSIELGFKEHYLIAQMVKDGVWDAHSLVSETSKEDGYTRYRIVYDPKKDPRFQGPDGQAFYKALRKSMVDTGEIEENEEIKGAYDNKLRERLKAYIGRNIGSTDRDLSSPLARYAFFHALSQFRSWFRDKFQRLTIKEYDAEIFGEYRKSKNGEYVWSPEPLKGMLRTLADFATMPIQTINLARKGELSREDQKNLWLAGTSLVTYSTLMVMMLALFNDDDDEEFSILKTALVAAQDDVMNSFTLKPYATLGTSPLVFASYYKKLFNKTLQVMNYGMEGDWKKSANTFQSIVPIINQLPDDED